MIHHPTNTRWFNELVMELRLRQVHGSAIGDTLASARELLADTGQSAEEAFGPARDYAAALELPTAPPYEWVRTALWPMLIALLAFLIFSQGVVAWAQGEQMLVSPAQAALVATPVVLVALLPVYLTVVMRRVWLLAILALVCAAAGFFSSVVAPATRSEAWLALNSVPILIASSLVMVLISVIVTVRSWHPGSSDPITDPLSNAQRGAGRGAGVVVAVTNWLFPLLALGLLGIALAFR